MVPVDFYKYREQLKRVLLARKESLTGEWDPFVASWIAYGLCADGIQNNSLLTDLAARIERWTAESESWRFQRNLGPLAFSCWLQRQQGKSCNAEFIERLSERVRALNTDNRLSILRDPYQVFLLTLGLSVNEEAKVHLKEVARQQVTKGPIRRRILYAAALKEMGEDISVSSDESQDAGDLIMLVWWAERYSEGLRREEQWERFSSAIDTISLDPEEKNEYRQALSSPEVALLYEAITKQASQPEPMLLFEYFPLHPRLKEIARDHFKNAKYVTAVEQGCRVLNELIQQKSGVYDKNEAELVQVTMKQIGNPSNLRIKLNDFLNEDSGKNEQAGLALIGEGVFKAFRNPKGHKPEDHPLVQIEPYEALAQLVTISYLMERIEKAET